MHKNKKGQVVASLTEVKNKTGDIFDLVDEYGEVVLTSYNKPRYKVVKIDISNILEESEKEERPEPKPKQEVPQKAPTPKPVVEEKNAVQEKPKQEKEKKKSESSLIPQEVVDMASKVKWWDRANGNETKLVNEVTKTLVD